MGKFSGYLKRLKQMFHNGVKGVKFVKDVWNKYITKPGVAILNTVIPESKPLTDILFKIDDKINQGFDWVLNKTDEPKAPAKIVGPGGIQQGSSKIVGPGGIRQNPLDKLKKSIDMINNNNVVVSNPHWVMGMNNKK